MGEAKRIRVEPIRATDARRIIQALHYSGKAVNNSSIHLGVFLDGKCGGALQFGPPMDKRNAYRLVPGTAWDGMVELNRMALAEWMPRNGESRAIAVACRILQKRYPQLEWIQSYSDGTQSGDGTIYRAAGFLLVGLKRNTTMLLMPDGAILADITFLPSFKAKATSLTQRYGYNGIEPRQRFLKRIGAKRLPGFQLRYVKFFSAAARGRLTSPVLPYSVIDEVGAGMYRGEKRAKPSGEAPGDQPGEGGSIPTRALHPEADQRGR